MAAQQLPLKVLQTDVAKDSARWTKKAFREGLVAPAVKGSDAPVTAFVKATPGAVGRVAGPSSGVKVLQTYGVPPKAAASRRPLYAATAIARSRPEAQRSMAGLNGCDPWLGREAIRRVASEPAQRSSMSTIFQPGSAAPLEH